MSKPTFPARNQWSSAPPEPAARPQAPQQPVATAVPRGRLPAELFPQRHMVPLQQTGTVGQPGSSVAAGMRLRMVQELQANGLQDERVVRAMLSVERHCFVDSGLMGQAYVDTSLPIGLQQTISKPSVVARMSELLLQSPAMQQQGAQAKLGRILEIGTGCGYQASVLSHIAAEVYSIERLKGLHEKAIANLRPFRVPNIHLILGDGMQGFAAGAPYAGIIAAAGGEAIPQAWVDQLAMGGRIVAPMAAGNGHQVLVVIDKTPNGLQQSVLEAVLFVPLKSGLT